MQRKLDKADMHRNQLIAKITKKREEEAHKQTAMREQKRLTKEEQERKIKVAAVKRQWQDGEISDDEYWRFMDESK